jgi:DNA uptake protein ComE-like DNA-binding protein
MYQLALPFFPDNQKLVNKMNALQERLQAKKEQSQVIPVPTEPRQQSLASSKLSLVKPMAKPASPYEPGKIRVRTSDDDYTEEALVEDELSGYDEEDSFQYRAKSRKRSQCRRKDKLQVFCDAFSGVNQGMTLVNNEEQTPRTKQVLRVINSRDVRQIMQLEGVGKKKAESIVETLGLLDGDIGDLEELGRWKGIGGKTVERMRAGMIA